MTDIKSPGGALSLRGVGKRYGEDFYALRDIDLEVAPGEFITLLGPSGSGKTTTLNLVAGFISPTEGTLHLDGRDLTHVPTNARDIGVVFQQYALFPHMSVFDNVAFPLDVRKVKGDSRRERVDAALDMVQLGAFAKRRPAQLSGGQQQRVALARAFVFQPRVLLMDEPLGALDKKLREDLQLEIMRICRELGATVLYVTHDQEEALVMSDRIAIYNEGRIEQIGSAFELYEEPATVFVANFVGESNLFHGTRTGSTIDTPSGRFATDGAYSGAELAPGECALLVRPERLMIAPMADATSVNGHNSIRGRIKEIVYVGGATKFLVSGPADRDVSVRVEARDCPDPAPTLGDEVLVWWRPQDSVLLPPSSVPAPLS